MDVCMHVYMCTKCMHFLQRTEKGIRFPATGDTDCGCWELACGCWDLNLYPLQEQ